MQIKRTQNGEVNGWKNLSRAAYNKSPVMGLVVRCLACFIKAKSRQKTAFLLTDFLIVNYGSCSAKHPLAKIGLHGGKNHWWQRVRF